ncbi:MAG: hypothetical protein L6420_01185, partial [Elusimicrobia bacterium]|nr:hypothetical protein [Elusimicrobiota bacterium]
THQGSVGLNHLDYYLDEFTFRFNRRKSASRGKLFYRLVQQSVQVVPAIRNLNQIPSHKEWWSQVDTHDTESHFRSGCG